MGNSLTRLFTRQHICPCQGQQPEYVEPEPILICSDHNCEHSIVADAGLTTSDNYDFLVKLTVVGPSLVGKTKLCAVITNEYKGSRRYEATIGVEFTTFRIRHNQHTLKVQLWDTAGKVEQRSIVRSYLRGTHVVLLVCDRQQPAALLDWLWPDMQQTILSDQTVCWLIADNHGKPDETADQTVISLTQQLLEKQSLKVAGATVFDFTDKANFNLCLHDIFKHLVMSSRRSYNGVYEPVAAKKPAIYCYSDTGDVVSNNNNVSKQLRVDIQLKGQLNIEIPTRDADSRWCCTVTGDQLSINNQPYPYIYWDANWPVRQGDGADIAVDTNSVSDSVNSLNRDNGVSDNLHRVPSTLQLALTSRCKQQFLMLAGDYSRFSQQLLTTVLNDRERTDFDEYWRPSFAGHPADTAFRVTVVDPDYFDTVFPLTIDTDATAYRLFRLEFIFEKLSHNNLAMTTLPTMLAVQRPSLPSVSAVSAVSADTAGNLLLVEWGGTILL